MLRILKSAERHQRRRDARLDREEDAEQHRGAGEEPERLADGQPVWLPFTIA